MFNNSFKGGIIYEKKLALVLAVAYGYGDRFNRMQFRRRQDTGSSS